MSVDNENLPARQHQRIHCRVHAAAFLLADHLIDEMQMPVRGADRAADHAVRLALLDQHCADQRSAAAHLQLRHLRADALPGHHGVIRLPEIAIPLVVIGIHNGEVHARCQTQTVLRDALRDHGRASYQDWLGNLLVHRDLDRAQHALLFALGEHNPLLVRLHAACELEHGLHGRAAVIDELLQMLFVRVHVFNRTRGHT